MLDEQIKTLNELLRNKYRILRLKTQKFKAVHHNPREVTNQDVAIELYYYAEHGSLGRRRVDKARLEKLHQLLAKLDTEDMYIVNMKFWQDKTNGDIAQRLGMSEAWVRLKLNKILGKLRF